MANVTILELVSLGGRHPNVRFLEQFGANCIVRLSIDPVILAPDVLQREMIVERRTPSTGAREFRESCMIGWQGTFSRDDCLKARRTSNDHRLTEDAAIVIMALLIHEFEKVIIENVLPIGSGGDYLGKIPGIASTSQVEVSGIRDDTKATARFRLQEKLNQVRTGYACVTTFLCRDEENAHSFLHHAEAEGKS